MSLKKQRKRLRIRNNLIVIAICRKLCIFALEKSQGLCAKQFMQT